MSIYGLGVQIYLLYSPHTANVLRKDFHFCRSRQIIQFNANYEKKILEDTGENHKNFA